MMALAPAMPGAKKDSKLGLDDFEFNEEGEVSKCPAGRAPARNKTNNKKGRHTVAFNSDVCGDCPHAANCPAKPGKNHRYLRYTDKELRLALRRQNERTPEFKNRDRMRAGVEATMSGLDRMTNIKRLRVRGLPAVRFAAFLKAAAVNIFRATAVKRSRKAANSSLSGLFSFILRPVHVFKERFHRLWKKTRKIFIPSRINLQPEAQPAS